MDRSHPRRLLRPAQAKRDSHNSVQHGTESRLVVLNVKSGTIA
jgi:hypothetical protein